MKLFNATQLTGLFAAFPFILDWVQRASFTAHQVVFWILLALYVVFFAVMTAAVYSGVCEWEK